MDLIPDLNILPMVKQTFAIDGFENIDVSPTPSGTYAYTMNYVIGIFGACALAVGLMAAIAFPATLVVAGAFVVLAIAGTIFAGAPY